MVDRLSVLAYKLHYVTVILHQGQGVRDNGDHYVHTYVVHKILLQRETILPCSLILILWKAYDTHFHRLYLSHRISDDSESPSAAQTCLYHITVVLLIPDVEDPLADADPVMAYPEGP